MPEQFYALIQGLAEADDLLETVKLYKGSVLSDNGAQLSGVWEGKHTADTSSGECSWTEYPQPKDTMKSRLIGSDAALADDWIAEYL